MLRTILIYCLLAFGTAQATVLTFGHAGADHLSLKGAISAASTGDTLLCIASYTDSMTVGATPGSLANLTIDFGGYTGTYNLTGPSDHVIDADYVNDFVLRNGTMIMNNCAGVELRGSGYMLVSGITQKLRGVTSGNPSLSATRSDTDSIRIEESTFQYEDLDGNQVNYPGHTNYGLQIAHDIPVRLINSTFRGGTAWLYYSKSTGAQSGEVEIDGCTFENGYYHSVQIEYGGNITVTNCTFQTDSVMLYAGLQIETPSGIAQDITVSGCTFTDVKLYVGMNGDDVAHGGAEGASAVISGNTFQGENITTQCQVRTNYAHVTGNTFLGAGGASWGEMCCSPHMLVLGLDGSADISDATAAENIRVYDNIFRPTTKIAEGVTTIMLTVVKTGTFHIYDNLYDLTAIDLPSTANRTMVFSLRSANDGAIYQNTFIFDDASWGVLDMSSQVDDTPCDGITFQDNLILGTYGSAVSTTDWNSWDDNQVYDSATIQSNYWGGGTVYRLISSSGYTDIDVVDAADSTNWFKATNFTTTDTYEYKFGGTGGLTYSAATPEGFIGIGYSPTSTDPVIASNNPGFESPMDALTTCRALGITGVELDYLLTRDGAADAMNIDIWLNGTHPNGSGTWEAQAQDTLKVVRVR
jgi:hypothetical protein